MYFDTYTAASWSAVISRSGMQPPKSRESTVQANIAAFVAAASLDRDTNVDESTPRLYRVMSRPHVIPGSPGAVKDIYVALCPCLSCRMQKERRALRTQHLSRLSKRPRLALTIRPPADEGRCVSHSLDTGCDACVRRVAESSSSEGSSSSTKSAVDSNSSGGISGVSEYTTSST